MEFPDTSIALPIPWHWNDEQSLVAQLHREIGITHPLYNRKDIRLIARRQDNDDVLFEFGEKQYAFVHLTWAQRILTQPGIPHTILYKDWNDVYQNRILRDAEWWEEMEGM